MSKEELKPPHDRKTFITDDKELQRKLNLLAYSFLRAAKEGEDEVAEAIIRQAQEMKGSTELNNGTGEITNND